MTFDTLDTAVVARITGLTSRTLRHYDAIGLLAPAATAPDGRRFYGPAEIARLQHILVLRELGTPLGAVAEILDAKPSDRARLLRNHLAALEAEAERFTTLAATVRRTIETLDNGGTMTPNEMFEGFDHSAHEPEAREHWGDDVVDRSNEAWKRLGPDGQKAHLEEARELTLALADAMKRGLKPADPETQAAVARHHSWVSLFWVPNREAYRGLGDMYVQDPRFAANYEKVAEGLAAYHRDAMHVYADLNLS